MRVYSISGYPEEAISVAFAKASRSPEPFDLMVSEISEESSKKFHEKWVLQYGHASVAEHAVLHIAAEGVSRLSVESLEESRLGSYTEKSTRYQKLGRESTHLPREIKGTALESKYSEALDTLFSAYESSLSALTQHFSSKTERRPNEPDKAYESRVRTQALDSARFLLPNATLANVGITMNARELRHATSKMLSHPLQEVRELGEKISGAAAEVAPTLLKNISGSSPSIREGFSKEYSGLRGSSRKKVSLARYDKEGPQALCAAIAHRWSGLPYEKANEAASCKEEGMFSRLEKDFLGGAQPPREFEHVYYTFELIMDQGAFCEFKRHRMRTLTPQEPTVRLGHETPPPIEEAGLKSEFENAMKASEEAFSAIAGENPCAAGYIATNAHNRRVLATMNLRELIHFVKLRTTPFAHFTIRSLALEMQEEVLKVHPEFKPFLNARRLP